MIRFQKMFLFLLLFVPLFSLGQTAYFVDGFHGGVWGHYPKGYSSFVIEQLDSHPDWKINLEIEPETWDREEKEDNASYQKFRNYLNNNLNSRIEYVNPSYAQPYLFNISGESMIRQFAYGITALRKHFPDIQFVTYSSEEPCFTSALPQILSSFGFKYASLKNPNTCWGGYTRAHGAEALHWQGPDGTSIFTVPRYAFEDLTKHSTWETIANNNSPEFIHKALSFGIKSPVGMCLQDAGWRNGPWLKNNYYQPTEYTTWRNYFENIVTKEDVPTWKLNQEDIQVSLVWGAQVLQKLAQEVRISEHKIIQAEKVAVIHKLAAKTVYPEKDFDAAWRTLMLAQHHDCWIVPYNNVEKSDSWADKVKVWTDSTNNKSDRVLTGFGIDGANNKYVGIQVYNTLGEERTGWVEAVLPAGYRANETVVLNKNGVAQPFQAKSGGTGNVIIFKATAPPFGYSVYQFSKAKASKTDFATVKVEPNGDYQLETDLYKIVIDVNNGGVIKNLIAKKLQGKDFVDKSSERKFNELRGHFYKNGGFRSSTESKAQVKVMQNGAGKLVTEIHGLIARHPFVQTLTLTEGQNRIDLNVTINWLKNEGIGEFEETNYRDTTLHKAFYNDQYKLLTLFPLSLKNQKVYKNAPFDVTESRLDHTFFSSWDSIKNNIILNWVDVVDGDEQYGMALYTDHTTSYTHGSNFPLGLNIQYSGKGLWGRNYEIDGPTSINYALIPHAGNWEKAKLSFENEKINEPLYAINIDKLSKNSDLEKSFLKIDNQHCILSSCSFKGDDLYIRIYNSSGSTEVLDLTIDFDILEAAWVDLNGAELEKVSLPKSGRTIKEIEMNSHGIKTLKVKLADTGTAIFRK